MYDQQPFRIRSITEYHSLMGLPNPEHPLVSVTRFQDITRKDRPPVSRIMDFYSIAIKRNFNAKIKYGQQAYDFDDGIVFCMAPGQVLRVEDDPSQKHKRPGWHLLVHPDFLWNTSLAKTIRKYEFFNYAVNEALFLSPREETLLIAILELIDHECRSNVDHFSQDVIIAQIELLLTYTKRFYHRQFITRRVSNHKVLEALEKILNEYFDSDRIVTDGLPTVSCIAEQLNISRNYLGSLLKVLTGLTTQQHIHEKLIEKAKERLSTTSLSVGEIAYNLGFEHPQSFSKLFKSKTNISPVEFRQGFR